MIEQIHRLKAEMYESGEPVAIEDNIPTRDAGALRDYVEFQNHRGRVVVFYAVDSQGKETPLSL